MNTRKYHFSIREGKDLDGAIMVAGTKDMSLYVYICQCGKKDYYYTQTTIESTHIAETPCDKCGNYLLRIQEHK
jgi:hypothetical protein